MKKYHYIYHTQIKNLKTGVVKHYFGKHSTNNLNDNYKGSGYYVRFVLNHPERYELFTRKLEFFRTAEICTNAEPLYIRSGKIKYGSLCVNLSDGGEGGTVYASTRVKNSNHAKRLWSSQEHRSKVSKSLKETMAKAEVKARMSEASKMSQSRPEVKAKQIENTRKALSSPEVKARHKASKRKGEVWKHLEALYELWLSNGTPGWRKFTKLAITNGYPNETYKSVICEFQSRKL